MRPLGEAKQPGGKIVHIWAIEGDWDAGSLKNNMCEMEWPPISGRRQTFPELDRAGWFEIHEAHSKILKGQSVFLDRLFETLASS
jgi:predicted NUDIX family NTP pyrophosphohydrolase